MMTAIDIQTYKIEDILKYKSLNTDMPEELLQFNETCQIIADTRNDIVIRHRKQISEKRIEPIDALKTAINSALNKLTAENIKIVKDELLSVQKTYSPDYINLLADALVNRASHEKNFIEIYAKMCQSMAQLKCTDGTYFNTYISNKCFKIFNTYTTNRDACEQKEQKEEKETSEISSANPSKIGDIRSSTSPDTQVIDRIVVINFIKFIGWLYIYDLLRISVVDVCINKVSENISKLDYGAEMITSILDVVSKKYFAADIEKISFVQTKLEKLCEIESLCKRDKILLQLMLEKIKKANIYVPPHSSM
jgi:hypothetical protein